MVYARSINDAGRVPSPLMQCKPDYASLVIDDATGLTLTTPTTAAAVKAAPVAAGKSSGMTTSVANGTLTCVKPGDYRVGFSCTDWGLTNSQVVDLEVYLNGAVIPAATGAIRAGVKMAGTAVRASALCGSGLVTLAKGDTLEVRAKADTGNLVIKHFNLHAVQLTDSGDL